jgi:adenylate kinase
VLMGPPGAGKGTQGRLLGEAFGVPWISSGDLLRRAVEEGSALGERARGVMARGDLLPDGLMDGLMRRRLGRPDAGRGFIADGYPRTVRQAQALGAALEGLGRGLGAALAISLAEDEVVDRLSGRRTCPVCGRVYHVTHEPPARAERCDADGASLIRREDDTAATIRRRLAVYHEESAPLIAHYAGRGLLREVDGSGPPPVVAERLRAAASAAQAGRVGRRGR